MTEFAMFCLCSGLFVGYFFGGLSLALHARRKGWFKDPHPTVAHAVNESASSMAALGLKQAAYPGPLSQPGDGSKQAKPTRRTWSKIKAELESRLSPEQEREQRVRSHNADR